VNGVKGPYQRLKYELRRVFECPKCHRREYVAGSLTYRFCTCPGKHEAPLVMKMVADDVRRSDIEGPNYVAKRRPVSPTSDGAPSKRAKKGKPRRDSQPEVPRREPSSQPSSSQPSSSQPSSDPQRNDDAAPPREHEARGASGNDAKQLPAAESPKDQTAAPAETNKPSDEGTSPTTAVSAQAPEATTTEATTTEATTTEATTTEATASTEATTATEATELSRNEGEGGSAATNEVKEPPGKGRKRKRRRRGEGKNRQPKSDGSDGKAGTSEAN
jgi:hypothetical protein